MQFRFKTCYNDYRSLNVIDTIILFHALHIFNYQSSQDDLAQMIYTEYESGIVNELMSCERIFNMYMWI